MGFLKKTTETETLNRTKWQSILVFQITIQYQGESIKIISHDGYLIKQICLISWVVKSEMDRL
jgi:hypothetical protein